MFNKSQSLNSLEKAIQKRKTTTMLKKSQNLNAIQKRITTLKKSASQLEILCGAQVCCIWKGATGNLEVWPENAADAVSVIMKYKKCKKKTKLCREVNRSNNVEQFEENKGLTLCDDDKGFDVDQLLSNSMEIFGDENKVSDVMSDDIDQFIMNNTMENVEPNKDFDLGGERMEVFDRVQTLKFEENLGFNQKGFSFGDDGLNNLSGESLKDKSDFLGSKIYRVDQRIASVEGDDHHHQHKFEYHVRNNGSNSVTVENNNDLSDHDFVLLLNDILGDTGDLKVGGFPGCSSSNINARMSTAPGFEDHKIDNVSQISLWPSSEYSGTDSMLLMRNHLMELENHNNNIAFLGEQPNLMGSNMSFGDIGWN